MKTRIGHINEICLWRNKDGTLTRTEQFVDYPLDDDGNRGDPDVEMDFHVEEDYGVEDYHESQWNTPTKEEMEAHATTDGGVLIGIEEYGCDLTQQTFQRYFS